MINIPDSNLELTLGKTGTPFNRHTGRTMPYIKNETPKRAENVK